MSEPVLVAADTADRWYSGWTVLLDCRTQLTDPEAGYRAYTAGHIPGAHYAHLDRDLSSPLTQSSGRHPLPDSSAFARTLGHWGIGPDTRVVVYDDAGGAIAARAWWLLRWVGHRRVALLDGGLAAWQASGRALTQALPDHPAKAPYPVAVDAGAITDAAHLPLDISNDTEVLVDARAAVRFAGREEPIDPVAGHIPGAVNRPVTDNLDAEQRFKSSAQLRAEWQSLLAGRRCIAMCGSGVTACHHLLALEIAGLPPGRLYPGSWSEWIRDPSRPVAKESST